MIDIRCRALDPSTTAARGRCQLAVGHEGEHALMYCRDHVRMLRRWSDEGGSDGSSVATDRPAGQDGLPWMRGLPMPAWTESEIETRPTTRAQPGTRVQPQR